MSEKPKKKAHLSLETTEPNIVKELPPEPSIQVLKVSKAKPRNTKAKSKKDQDVIQILMGDEVAPRKDFIINRALEVSNLDI